MQKSSDRIPWTISDVCSTCLASDRKLVKLESAPQCLQICNGLTLLKCDMICYECKARLCNMLLFRSRALRVQKWLYVSSLALLNPSKRKKVRSLKCLSTLTQTSITNLEVAPLVDAVLQVKTEPVESVDTEDVLTEPFVLTDCRFKKQCPRIEVPSLKCLSTLTRTSVPPLEVAPLVDAVLQVKTEPVESVDTAGLLTERVFEVTEESLAECKSETAGNSDSETDTASEDGTPRPATPKQQAQPDDFIVREIEHAEVVASLASKRDSDRFKKAQFRCAPCALVFTTEKGREAHLLLHSDAQGQFKCVICQQRFETKGALDVHFAAHYRRYDCLKCDRIEYCPERIKAHYVFEHDDTPRYCDKCNERFTTYADWRNHRRAAHTNSYPCSHCGRTFKSNTTRQQHIAMIHTKVASVECDVCHKRYKGQFNLQIHMRLKHSKDSGWFQEKAYCAQCKMQFRDIHQYRVHMQKTAKHVKPESFRYECDYCGKRFVQKANVSHHIELMHLRVRRYPCDVCGERFLTGTYRNKHKRKKHSNKTPKRYVCHVCGKSFKLSTSLKQHMNCHLGLRPYACTRCDATFAYAASLFTHNRLVHLRKKRGQKKDSSDS